jgi:hypothetical protein
LPDPSLSNQKEFTIQAGNSKLPAWINFPQLSTMRRLLYVLFAFLLFSGRSAAQQEIYSLAVDVKEKSQLTIHGSSNVIDFKLYQPGDSFLDRKLFVSAVRRGNRLHLSESQLEIPVKDFASGNKMALRDFHRLVRSDEFPSMRIELDHIELPSNDYPSGGNAVVDVTITNVTRRYIFPVQADKKGSFFAFDVHKKINIRDFNLTPPVHMMGMLKVDEWITINLYLECGILPTDQADLTFF